MKKTQVSWVWSLPWDSFCLSWLPLPIKWWQYLKPSSKAVLQKKHWHKSSGKGSASASWVLFCAFTHCLLSGAAYCHIWGKELWLRTRRETYAVPVNAPALLPSVRLEGTWSHPAVPRLLWKKINVSSCAQVTLEGEAVVSSCAQLTPLPAATRDALNSAKEYAGNSRPFFPHQPTQVEPLQVCQENNSSNLSILFYDFRIPVNFLNSSVYLTPGF